MYGAAHDQECFKYGTDAADSNYADLAALWKDQGIKTDLDGDGVSTQLEKAAWFERNEYVACRPVRDKVLEKLQQINIKLLY